MYPELLHIGSLTLYSYAVFVVIGLFAATLIFRILADKVKMPDKVYNFYLLTAIGSIVVGFVFAMLYQSLYYFISTGEWSFGALTFMGGLIGGVGCFLLVTAIFAKKEYKRYFWLAANLLAPSIVAAHSFGRIGCFMNGCCYGKQTDSAIGVLFPGDTHKVIPTQLIEAIFLALLCVALFLLILKFKRVNLAMLTYLYAYAIFRFILEFWRGDDRGSFLGGISPSQWQSVFMLLVGIALTVYIYYGKRIPFAGKCSVTTFGYEPLFEPTAPAEIASPDEAEPPYPDEASAQTAIEQTNSETETEKSES